MAPVELHAVAVAPQRSKTSLIGQKAPATRKTPMIGVSTAFAQVMALAQRVAPSDCSVLLTGETGTGKELFAQVIHMLSARSKGRIVALNCAGFPAELLESELFGHVKGAFTGSTEYRRGLVEQAEGGTLFLDEIGDIPLPIQVKLLRLLEERKIRRLGQSEETDCDIRIVAATNKDLSTLIREGKFRDDLFYRLNVVTIELPPLRERKGDVWVLAEAFLHEFSRKNKREPLKFSPEAKSALEQHSWPGNVRELRNAIERAVVMTHGQTIEASDLRLGPASTSAAGKVAEIWDLAKLPDAVAIPEGGMDLRKLLQQLQILTMEAAIRRTPGNLALAGRLLGYGRRQFYKRVSYDLPIYVRSYKRAAR